MPKQIIKNQKIVTDSFVHVGLEGEIPAGDVIVPYSRFLAEQEQLAVHDGQVAVSVNGNDYDIYAIGAELAKQSIIALEFPAFVDGRCYSFARLLRERFGFEGELRAYGNVLRDQTFYMHRCGIDTYEVEEGKDLEVFLEGFKDFSVSYQPIPRAI
jgi:uncharacterized protein (DUF934 family)